MFALISDWSPQTDAKIDTYWFQLEAAWILFKLLYLLFAYMISHILRSMS